MRVPVRVSLTLRVPSSTKRVCALHPLGVDAWCALVPGAKALPTHLEPLSAPRACRPIHCPPAQIFSPLPKLTDRSKIYENRIALLVQYFFCAFAPLRRTLGSHSHSKTLDTRSSSHFGQCTNGCRNEKQMRRLIYIWQT